ncbi:DUF4190 domain-containing protein [Streptomyces sp. NBC_01264]|uniref:DUF4190 domain-containing protein n=1 Tax=Streptomyces sp. NBC_01264 TaxID=2903804 RepID=UPI00224E6DE6|nr:DUF4190 domain-containing protein [Streptomyces sp. NBC_01264]MCX4777992.1 DUF4352 domain-containing protein [Streptomyces sp. NBC_01264]
MSTPPNPPSTPSGPPTEPAGTPVPETARIPAPAQPLSLEKPPAEPADAVPAEPADAVPGPAPVAVAAEPTNAVPAEPADAVPAPAPAAIPAEPTNAVPAAPAPAPGSFAPVTPAPAAATTPPAPVWGAPYGAPGAPGGPAPASGNPWAAPGYGAGYPGGPHAPGFPPPPPATNGPAVAALLLGLFGIFVGLVPFFFWAGALLALTGVGLGIAAVVKSRRGAPRATMAAVGTALAVLGLGASVGGWFITAHVIHKIDETVADNRARYDYDDDYDYDYDYAEPSAPAPKPSPSPTDTPGITSALAWGTPYTYKNGVQVTVQSAVPYTPSSTAAPKEARNGNAVKVKVKIVNNSGTALDVSLSLPHARDDQGTEAEMVFDGSVPKLFDGSVLAGESMTGTFAFLVPEGTKSLHFEIAPGIDYDDAIWSGPIGR